MFYTFISMYNTKFFLQENDVVVRLIEEKSTFNKLHERKIFLIVKKYKHPTDLFVDIKYGKLDLMGLK